MYMMGTSIFTFVLPTPQHCEVRKTKTEELTLGIYILFFYFQ